MATLTELQSLNELEYKSKVKIYIYVFLVAFLFVVGFLNYFPISDKFKAFLKSNLKGTACNPDFKEISLEWVFPKIVVSDLVLPASCLGKTGEPLKFNFLRVNFNLVSFSPLGIPFKVETEMNGQMLTLYFVQGWNQRLLRLKDQSISLQRLQPFFGDDLKIAGNAVVDLNVHMSKQTIRDLALKAQSKDLQFPSQSIQGFTMPNLKVNSFYLEANAVNSPRITIDKLIIGDPNSPMRANFKGKIDLEDRVQFSPIDLQGEVAFSESFRSSLPLVDMLFQSFTQKDGFYQVRLGGTLGAPKPIAQ
jgi:type II secretion system protein N